MLVAWISGHLIFPVDRSWLLTTLWDDDWSCIVEPMDS
jgi:hypothetical protein